MELIRCALVLLQAQSNASGKGFEFEPIRVEKLSFHTHIIAAAQALKPIDVRPAGVVWQSDDDSSAGVVLDLELSAPGIYRFHPSFNPSEPIPSRTGPTPVLHAFAHADQVRIKVSRPV